MLNLLPIHNKYKGTNRGARKRVIRGVRKTAGLFDAIDSPSLAEGARGWVNPNESSLRGSVSVANTTKQSTINANKYANLNNLSESWIASANQDSPQNDESLTNDKLFALDESFAFDSLKSNDTFFYKNDSLLLADIQSERQRRLQNSTQSLNTRNANQTNNNSNSIDLTNRTNQANSTNQTNISNNSNTNLNTRSTNPNQSTGTTMNRTIPSNQNYYFILTPFINHNYFFEIGRYNLSGLEYGFVTAFSGKLNKAQDNLK